MCDWDGKYIVVEQALAAEHPRWWVASAVAESLQAARAILHVDAEPVQAPRSAFMGEDMGATLLLRGASGTPTPRHGRIYRLTLVTGEEGPVAGKDAASTRAPTRESEPVFEITQKPRPVQEAGPESELDHQQLIAHMLLERAGVATTDMNDYAQLNMLGMMGSHALNTGDIAGAEQHFTELVEIARRIDHSASLIKGCGSLGTVKSRLGRVDEAIMLFNEALIMARQGGLREEEGITLSNLAEAHARAGNGELAIATHMERRKLARQTGDRRGFALSTANVGITCFELQKLDDAITFLKVAVHEFRTLRMTPELARALAYLGVTHQAKGDLQQAMETYQFHIRFCNSTGDFSTAGTSYVNFCMILRGTGQVEEATQLAKEGCIHLHNAGAEEATQLQKLLHDWSAA